jgi:cell division protease FtsH
MSLKAVLAFTLGLLAVAGAAGLIAVASGTHARGIPISDLAQLAKDGQIASIEVSGDTAVASTRQQDAFELRVEPSASLTQQLQAFGVTADELSQITYTVTDPPRIGPVATVLGALLPVLLLGGLVVVALRGGSKQHDLFSFGKARGRVLSADWPRTTFDDVAGVDEAKYELQEVVQFLKFPARFTSLGASLPHGVLLVGPPGTGKTLLARAVAGEAGVPFFSISGSEFVEMFVGVGASRVRDLFDQAKRVAPCIVFIDEIDAVGRRRGIGFGGGNDEREQTLNQMLVEMDGFHSGMSVIVIGATNRPEVLDPALLRPGRFDRQIQVAAPDVRGREAVLRVHARGKPLDDSVDLGALARSTPGFSGADLSNVLNEAAILAARRHNATIDGDDIEEAVDRVVAGPAAESRVMTESERRLTAYHEAGHAVVARFLERHDPVHKITIVGRGRAGGYTRFLPTEDRHYQTRSHFEASIASALGGHAAETLVFGEMSTGASNDLERATALARRMVTEYGMSARLGAVTLGSTDERAAAGGGPDARSYSEHTAQLVDREVRRLVDEAYAQARSVILEQRPVLDRLAHALLQLGTLQGAELERAFSNSNSNSNSNSDSDSDSGDVTAPPEPRPETALRSHRRLTPLVAVRPAAAAIFLRDPEASSSSAGQAQRGAR